MTSVEGFVARLHEDLVYVIECLAEDLPGEAKHEMSSLAATVAESALLDHDSRERILGALAEARASLLMDGRDIEARRRLVQLRRGLRNTLDVLAGVEPTYTVQYAPPLPVQRPPTSD